MATSTVNGTQRYTKFARYVASYIGGRYATFALTNLASVQSTHTQLIDAGIITLFTGLLQEEDASIRNAAAFGIANFAAFSENHRLIVESGNCLEALIDLVSSADGKSVLRADVVRMGGLPPLLRLTHSKDMDVQQEVLACLCNLSLSGCIGADPSLFLSACDVQSLVSFLCSADATYRLFGAITLGNVAAKAEHHETIVGSGALTPLIELSRSVDLETHRCIAFALCNLASEPARRQSIVDNHGIPPIIALACSE
ncbi:hypothetical protein AaE_005472, partial [Aphanomyces astaci]